MKMKIKIVSDGTQNGTKVFAGDTEISGVTSAVWYIDINGAATAMISLVNVTIDVVGEVEECQ